MTLLENTVIAVQLVTTATPPMAHPSTASFAPVLYPFPLTSMAFSIKSAVAWYKSANREELSSYYSIMEFEDDAEITT